MDAEVIVVGAGPGGSSAAYHLAERGRRVLLLDRQAFPRDKSCGDGLTPFAVRLLDEMGVLGRLGEAQRVEGGRILMRGRGSRDFVYPRDSVPGHGLVVPRMQLDEALRRHAVEAGATFVDRTKAVGLRYEGKAVVGVNAVCRGESRPFRAPVVVAADGAASRLARQAGGMDPDPQRLGYALRGYYEGVEGLADLLELYMPLTDASDRYVLPSYGWVFPTGPTTANVGVGVFERVRGANVRRLFERFLEHLRRTDARLHGARLCGAWKGAPMRFDFVPERCHAPGLVLVGDAAGTVSPFTGEGISYAIESGRLAAEAIDRNLRPGRHAPPDLSDYGLLMGQHYAGYFEAGRRSARRYQLVWHVLDGTFHNERPLFVLCRRAVLFPEGMGESHPSKVLDDVGPLLPPGRLRVREDLLAVGDVMMESVRRDWPFLGRLSAAGKGDPGTPFRPALLLLLSSYFGDPKAPHLVRVAAAVEMGYLAGLAHASVGEEPAAHSNGHADPNWGNMLAVMAGDFMLTRAYHLCAEAGALVSQVIIEALERVCEGRVAEVEHAYDLTLGEAEHRAILRRKTATLFALPCRLGALLSAAPPEAARALARYGTHLGLAFQLADDALDLRGQASRLGKATGTDLREGVYSLAVLRALEHEAEAECEAEAPANEAPANEAPANEAPAGGGSSGQEQPLREQPLREQPLREQPLREQPLRELLGRARLGEAEVAAVRARVVASGAVEEALAAAGEEARRAQEALAGLAAGPARRALHRLAAYAVERDLPERADLESLLDA